MRFIVMSDPHFTIPNSIPDGTWWYRTLASRAEDRNSSLIRTIRSFNPVVVVNCGDFTGDGRQASFKLGKEVMDKTGCEWITAVGNHDTNWPGVREEISALYSLPSNVNYYSHLLRSGKDVFCFLVLDLCWHVWRDGSVRPHIDTEAFKAGEILRFAIDDGQLKWLDQQLEKHRDHNVFLVTHTPIVYKKNVLVGTLPKTDTVVNREVALNTLNPELESDSAERLKTILKKHRQTIRMVFSGHTHIHEVIYQFGIPFCTTASLRECPFELRVADVEGGRMRISTQGLDDPTLFADSYEEWRNNEWIMGASEDRDFEILFTVGKQQRSEVPGDELLTADYA
jgi:3',5'-cyclic AMP phosphodiesterase CpdA